MAELFLVRHGQASFGHKNYDQLSDLGKQQAKWLGAYFTDQGLQFDRVVTGNQVRHHQTAECIAEGMGLTFDFDQFAGLNEYDFQGLIASAGSDSPALKAYLNGDRKAFFTLFNKMLKQWAKGELQGHLPESWESFYSRVRQGFEFAKQTVAKRVLVVSSGGVIGTAVGQVMQAPPEVGIGLNLIIKNCSVSHFYFKGNDCTMNQFNSVAQFESANKRHAITFG